MCQNARKMHHFEAKNPKIFWQPPHQTPPHWEGDTPSLNLIPVFEYCQWQNCYWNDVNTETETELKLFLKNFIETRTEKNSDTV